MTSRRLLASTGVLATVIVVVLLAPVPSRARPRQPPRTA